VGITVPPFSLAAIALIISSETPAFIIAAVDPGRRSKSTAGAEAMMRRISGALTPAATKSQIR
jgi:hypothetical protein